MENRRLCDQEDRVFNERLKLTNALEQVPLLPRVGRFNASQANSTLTSARRQRLGLIGSSKNSSIEAREEWMPNKHPYSNDLKTII